jgi:hypothetical protein
LKRLFGDDGWARPEFESEDKPNTFQRIGTS